jgi:hypothetical protein
MQSLTNYSKVAMIRNELGMTSYPFIPGEYLFLYTSLLTSTLKRSRDCRYRARGRIKSSGTRLGSQRQPIEAASIIPQEQ